MNVENNQVAPNGSRRIKTFIRKIRRFIGLLLDSVQGVGFGQTIFQVGGVLRAMVSGQRFCPVIRPAGLGDLLCLAPSLLELQSNGEQVVLITRVEFIPVVQRAIGRCIAISAESLVDVFLRRYVREGDYRMPLNGDEYSPKRQCPPVHLVDAFAQTLHVTPKTRQPHVILRMSERRGAQKQIRDLSKKNLIVAIHIGPTWAVKQWPIQYWSALVMDIISTLSCDVLQVGSSQNTGTGKADVARISGAIDCVDRFSILETGAILSQCDLFIGIDSGMLHLAGAVGTKSIGIFGPTMGRCFAPIETPSIVVQSRSPCAGCHHCPVQLHWRDGCPYGVACMQEIAPAEVFAAAKQLLTTTSGIKL